MIKTKMQTSTESKKFEISRFCVFFFLSCWCATFFFLGLGRPDLGSVCSAVVYCSLKQAAMDMDTMRALVAEGNIDGLVTHAQQLELTVRTVVSVAVE